MYKSKHTRQRSAVATQSFMAGGDLQATDISNLLQAHVTSYDSLTNIFLPLTNFTVFSSDIPYILATVAPASPL